MGADAARVYWAEPRADVAAVVGMFEQAGHEVRLGPDRREQRSSTPPEALAAALTGVRALLASGRDRISRDVLERAPDLRIVSKIGVGVDTIDRQAATELGILVTNTPVEEHVESVAEGALARIFAVAKRLPAGDRLVRSGGWERPTNRFLKHSSVGLVGYGRIGRRVASLLRPFGAHLLATDPLLAADRSRAEAGVEVVGLDELLGRADIVSLHAVPAADGRALIAEPELRRMKRSALLVNTARGALVDAAALAAALRERQIAGAAIDVFEREPPSESPLLAPDLADRLLLTPHSSGSTAEATAQMLALQVSQCLAALKGELPAHVCNPAAIARWSARGA